MTLNALLESLTEQERDFIAHLDYGMDAAQHRSTLDQVIAAGGIVDFETMGYWHPYEVIELGKNWLQEGHEREYAACLGVVLKNIETGADRSSDLEWIVETQAESISRISSELKDMMTDLIENIINNPIRTAYSSAPPGTPSASSHQSDRSRTTDDRKSP